MTAEDKNQSSESNTKEPSVQVYKDIREWMTAAGTHQCEGKVLTSIDEQGNNIYNTYTGFRCSCGDHFKITLYVLKATMRPLRKYITTCADRAETSRRLSVEPEVILLEMQNSGGWDQINPQAAMALAIAAAIRPEGNEHEQGLNKWMAGHDPK